MQAESRFPTAFLLVPAVPQPAKRAGLPCVGCQEWDAQSVVWTAHSPGQVSARGISLFLWGYSWWQAPSLITFLFLLITCGSFLQPWLYRSPSASFQREYFHVHMYFDVFMKGCEIQVLVLCHLDVFLSTYSVLFLSICSIFYFFVFLGLSMSFENYSFIFLFSIFRNTSQISSQNNDFLHEILIS